jgi:hypothetical protein
MNNSKFLGRRSIRVFVECRKALFRIAKSPAALMGIRLIGREQERDMLWVAPWEPAHLSSLVEYAIHQGSQQILRHQRDGKRSYTGARYRLCGITCAQCDAHRARDAEAALRFEATTAFLPTLAVRSRCLQRQLNVDSSRPVGAKSGRRRSSSATSGSVWSARRDRV